MANLETKFNRNEVVFLKYNGKVYGGHIVSISATLATLQQEWWVKYDIQTGEDTGIDCIPQEHLFRSREEAEADKTWENRNVTFIGYRGR